MDADVAELKRQIEELKRKDEERERKNTETERQLQEERRGREEAERREEEERRGRLAAETGRLAAEAKLRNTTFSEYLDFCHNGIFRNLRVQMNKLLASTGQVAVVTNKCYPRQLRPWTEFDGLHDAVFSQLEARIGDRRILPSMVSLEHVAKIVNKNGRKVASEEDVKQFSSVAIEGCVEVALTELLPFLLKAEESTSPSARPSSPISAPPMPPPLFSLRLPRELQEVSFTNSPFGVTSKDEDEVTVSDGDEEEGRAEAGPSSQQQRAQQRQPQRGRSRTNRKELIIRDDRAAYISALATAQREVEAAEAAAAALAAGASPQGRPKKRLSPQRTRLRPDMWCFLTDVESCMAPLFIVEFKAAHKMDKEEVRRALQPARAVTLMEDAIRVTRTRRVGDDPMPAMVDVAKVITQTFDYMIDYGLQYGYASTGESLILLHIDPDEPTVVYYRLAQPATDVASADRAGLRQTSVALVLTMVFLAMQGEHMSLQWKTEALEKLCTWPDPYDDADNLAAAGPAGSVQSGPPLHPPRASGSQTCRDPEKGRHQKHDSDSDSSGEEDGGGGRGSGGDSTYRGPASRGRNPASNERVTRSQSRGGAGPTDDNDISAPMDNAPMTQQGTTRRVPRSAPIWTYSAKPSPTPPYCTQACLLGLKTNGPLDLHCPNVGLHRKSDGTFACRGKAVAVEKHPITAAELCTKLTVQLGQTMDEDCDSLERFGLFGASGALFRLYLRAYGYCLVAKAVQREDRNRLALEMAAYRHLEACQGRLVPVYLGVVALQQVYRNMYGAHFTHMMLMSYSGEPLWRVYRRLGGTAVDAEEMEARFTRERERTLDEVRPFGVLHGDVNTSNTVWSEELQRVMLIDFDRAVLRPADDAKAAEWPEETERQKESPKARDTPRKRKMALVDADSNAVSAVKRRVAGKVA